MRTDIFGMAPRQHDMFGVPQETFDIPMTVDDIRAELTEALALLRCSDSMPWPVKLELQVRNMFPEIAGKLPKEEAAALVAAFDAEILRLRPQAA